MAAFFYGAAPRLPFTGAPPIHESGYFAVSGCLARMSGSFLEEDVITDYWALIRPKSGNVVA